MLKNLSVYIYIFFGSYHLSCTDGTFFLTLQERNKYLFSFNFVALNFVLPQLEQVDQTL